jgi:oligoribonuclease
MTKYATLFNHRRDGGAKAKPMAASPDNLLWVDMEMSGLNPDTDRVLEVAIVVTDSQLNTVAEAPVLVVHQSDAVLDAMDSWNRSTHAKSGLTERVKASALAEAEVERQLVEFLAQYVPTGISPMCGNTVHQDRRFMARHLPALETFFHYRNLDVSTLKELMKRWRPDLAAGFVKHGKHEALADIYESIDELKYYREHFLKV